MKHIDQITTEQRPDGVLVTHTNGAKHLIPLARYLRWCLAELKGAMTLPRANDKPPK